MRRVFWTMGVCALLAAGPATAEAAKKVTHAPLTDQQIDQRIEKRFSSSAALKHEHISVSVKDHVATLSGSVDSARDKTLAERYAKLGGAAKVENQLNVEARGTTGHESSVATPKGTAGKAAEKTKEGLNKTGEVITDSWITTKVKAQFVGEDALKGSDISVETTDHAVTLKGTVASAAGRTRAVAIARATDGVTKVNDDLRIGAKK